MFNLSLSEIDSHLRHAGTPAHVHKASMLTVFQYNLLFKYFFFICAEIMLQNFRKEVSTVFSSFILGKIIQQNSQQHEVIHE